MIRTLAADDVYLPNKMVPFGAALTFHILMFAWNPTILSGGDYHMAPQLMEVKFLDKLPPITEPVKAPLPKPVEKKRPVKKARKSGMLISTHHAPIAITRHPLPTHAPAARRPFVSKITMPKFVPHDADEPIAASVAPGISAPSPHRMVQAYAPPPKLKGKSRGIRASDINFELSDRGSLGGASGPVVNIPIGEESGETASLPSATVLHEAPTGAKTFAGYRYQPGSGSGSGELSGRERKGGYHGVVQADTYVEGSIVGASGGRGKGIIGNGFEIGGPVGDRKILRRRLPEYPDWAEEKGISAIVRIYFTVRPDGTIRQTMRIERSSGYTELDQLAKDALSNWKFSPTSASSSEQEAWGIITFKFTLS